MIFTQECIGVLIHKKATIFDDPECSCKRKQRLGDIAETINLKLSTKTIALKLRQIP